MGEQEYWTITVSMDKNKLVTVKANCTVNQLIEKACTLSPAKSDPADLQLIFAGKTMVYGENKRLSDFNVVNNSVVVAVFRMLGGVWPIDELRDKSQQLEPLTGYITVTSLESDGDIISFENSPLERRAKMPCGHVIGPSSMTSLCQSLITQGLFTFHCPAILAEDESTSRICNQEWPYFLVRHVACLLPEEMQEFDKRISENYLNKAAGRLQCPGCKMWGFRDDTTTNRMRCTYCSIKKGMPFEFCWSCSNKWRGETECGNEGCDGQDKRIKILKECQDKKIEEITAPSIRGCPKCGTLIEHKDQCKHMTCSCTYSFCFICLQPKAQTGWLCKAYGNDCKLAERQKTLPGC